MRRPFLTFFTLALLLCALSSPAVYAAKGGKSKGHRNAKLESGDPLNDGGSARGLTRALERDNSALEGGHGRMKSYDGDDTPTGKASGDSGDDAGSAGKGRGKAGAKGAGADD